MNSLIFQISSGIILPGKAILRPILIALICFGNLQAQVGGDETQSKSAFISVSGKVVEPTATEAILLEAVYSPSFIRKTDDNRVMRVDPVADEAGSTGGAGFIIAQGLPNRSFRVVIPRVVEMINRETESRLNVHVVVSHNAAPEQSNSVYLRQPVRDLTLNEDGEYYFWIGGNIQIADVENGAYEGQFTLELEYL